MNRMAMRGRDLKDEALPTDRGPRLGTRCPCIEVIHKLKSRLSAQNIRRFKESCFGQFIDLPPLVFQGTLISSLLMNTVDERSRSILKFKFKNVVAEFRRDDFFLLTGLPFAKTKGSPKRSVLHETVFGGCKSITVDMIEGAFDAECTATKGAGENALKLGFLLLVYECLLGVSSKHNTHLDLQYMHAVDDISSVSNFPWGREAYDFFISQYYATYDKWLKSTKWKRSDVIDLNGLNLVIQWWMYETFPGVASKFSDVVDRHAEKWPRMLRWWSLDIPFFSKEVFNFDVASEVLHVKMLISPYEEEKMKQGGLRAKKRISHTHTMHVKSGITKRKLEFNHDPPSISRKKSDASTPVHESVTEGTPVFSTKEFTDIKSLVEDDVQITKVVNYTAPSVGSRSKFEREMMQGMKELLKKVNLICEKVPALGEHSRGAVNTILEEPIHSKGEGMDSTIKLHANANPESNSGAQNRVNVSNTATQTMKEVIEVGEDHIISYSENKSEMSLAEYRTLLRAAKKNSVLHKNTSNVINVVDLVTSDSVAGRNGFIGRVSCTSSGGGKSASDEHHSTGSTQLDGGTSSATSYHEMFDPFKAAGPDSVAEMKKWHKHARERNSDFCLMLPLSSFKIVEAKYLDRLVKESELLRDEVCDLLLNLLMYNASTCPDSFKQDWACLDHLAWNRIYSFKKEEAFKTVVKYAEGTLPHERQLAWRNVKRIYGVAHVNKAHWVAYEVDFIGEFIMVYDSLSSANTWDSVAGCFHRMSIFLPWLFKKLGIRHIKGLETTSDKWSIINFPDTPQQVNGYDCGIMALKMVECLVSGRSLLQIDPFACPEYRDGYCGQLWDLRQAG